MSQTVQTTLQIGTQAQALRELRELLKDISREAGGVRSALDGLGTGYGPGGGGGGGGSGGGASAGGTRLVDPETGRPVVDTGGAPGGGGAGGGGGGGGRRGRDRGTLAERLLYGGRFEGRRVAGLAGLGIGGLIASQGVSTATGALGQYWQQEAVLARGLASGDWGTAASASTSAFYGRKRAGLQAGVGAGSIAGGAMIAAGAELTSTGVGAKVGIPLILAGALTTAISNIEGEFQGAVLATLEAQEQAAISTMKRLVEKRTAIATASAEIVALGGTPLQDKDYRGIAGRFGYAPDEANQHRIAFRRAGGHSVGDSMIYGLERGLNLQAGEAGRFTRSFYGPYGGGRLSDQSAGAGERFLWATIKDALAAGIREERLGEYLGQIASANERFLEEGIVIDVEKARRVRAGMLNAGMSPGAAEATMGSAAGQGQQLLQSLSGLRMPPGMSQALLMRAALSQYGSVDEAMRGIEGSLARNEMPSFIRGVAGGLDDPTMRSAFIMQTLGGGPTRADRFMSARDADAVAGAGAIQSLGDRVRSVTEREDFTAIRARAIGEATESLAVTLPKLAETMNRYLRVIELGIENYEMFGAKAVDRLDAAMSKAQSTKEYRGLRDRSWSGAQMTSEDRARWKEIQDARLRPAMPTPAPLTGAGMM